MERSFGAGRIELVTGNLVEQAVDVIVNAASESLLGGGGVDGAIHRAAGPRLLELCRAFPTDAHGRRCRTGEAKTTEAGNLSARWVVHAVGPVYDPRSPVRAADLLRSAHAAALSEVVALGARSVAFPAISTGAYRFPMEEASAIALVEVRRTLLECPHLELVRFVLFKEHDLRAFERTLRGLPG